MSELLHESRESVKYFAKILEYPDGSRDIIAADKAVFGPRGWEAAGSGSGPAPTRRKVPEGQKTAHQTSAENLERARSRARAQVRRLALCNDFRWFVTLTIDPQKLDSLDSAATVRRLSQWLSNQVKRRGLRYVLVPELHKSGRIHFHGFFNDCIQVIDSTHRDPKGHGVYNIPGWKYGFSTAIELYGDYHAAVGYTCKYIGKDSTKIGGRWYYSGGQLQLPVEKYVDISSAELVENFGDAAWYKQTPGGTFAGVTGLKGDL